MVTWSCLLSAIHLLVYTFPVSRTHSTCLAHNPPDLITLMLYEQHLYVILVALFTVTTGPQCCSQSPRRSATIFHIPQYFLFTKICYILFPCPTSFQHGLSIAFCTSQHPLLCELHCLTLQLLQWACGLLKVRVYLAHNSLNERQGLFTVFHVFWMNPR
jgi:hypothetical protein